MWLSVGVSLLVCDSIQDFSLPGNTKKIRKNYEIPHPGSAPENTKIREKYENGHFWAIFRIFSVFFSYFRGPTQDGGFRNFFVFVSCFRA